MQILLLSQCLKNYTSIIQKSNYTKKYSSSRELREQTNRQTENDTLLKLLAFHGYYIFS